MEVRFCSKSNCRNEAGSRTCEKCGCAVCYYHYCEPTSLSPDDSNVARMQDILNRYLDQKTRDRKDLHGRSLCDDVKYRTYKAYYTEVVPRLTTVCTFPPRKLCVDCFKLLELEIRHAIQKNLLPALEISCRAGSICNRSDSTEICLFDATVQCLSCGKRRCKECVRLEAKAG